MARGGAERRLRLAICPIRAKIQIAKNTQIQPPMAKALARPKIHRTKKTTAIPQSIPFTSPFDVLLSKVLQERRRLSVKHRETMYVADAPELRVAAAKGAVSHSRSVVSHSEIWPVSHRKFLPFRANRDVYF